MLAGESRDSLHNTSVSRLFSKASNIFMDSYIYPLLLNESEVKEIQMSLQGVKKSKVPVIVNIKLGLNGTSYWSIYECTNRDKLQNELINAKKELEQRTKELYELATTDPLTGLLNRREFFALAQKITSQVSRNKSTFAILSIDVDLFKVVNDTYGHQAGDNVLKRLATLLSEGRRCNDLVARVGGEEFVLMLPDIDETSAFIFAENLRENIANELIDEIKITVSIGLIVSNKHHKADFDVLLNLSDQALYRSKNNGRNRTTISQY